MTRTVNKPSFEIEWNVSGTGVSRSAGYLGQNEGGLVVEVADDCRAWSQSDIAYYLSGLLF